MSETESATDKIVSKAEVELMVRRLVDEQVAAFRLFVRNTTIVGLALVGTVGGFGVWAIGPSLSATIAEASSRAQQSVKDSISVAAISTAVQNDVTSAVQRQTEVWVSRSVERLLAEGLRGDPGVDGPPGERGPAGPRGPMGATDAPIGAIVAWAGTSPPEGWAFCDGATYLIPNDDPDGLNQLKNALGPRFKPEDSYIEFRVPLVGLLGGSDQAWGQYQTVGSNIGTQAGQDPKFAVRDLDNSYLRWIVRVK